ncbi:glycosyltransferase [Granulicella tundricola]|uniref:glycosyltransferase n=1 Tax=Granulicella tundricola TaxID=940615 RepID=UPI00059FFD6E
MEPIVYQQEPSTSIYLRHSHLTFAMYLRLFMTEYLDPSLEEVLYLGSDIIICCEIDDLWSFPSGMLISEQPPSHTMIASELHRTL